MFGIVGVGCTEGRLAPSSGGPRHTDLDLAEVALAEIRASNEVWGGGSTQTLAQAETAEEALHGPQMAAKKTDTYVRLDESDLDIHGRGFN